MLNPGVFFRLEPEVLARVDELRGEVGRGRYLGMLVRRVVMPDVAEEPRWFSPFVVDDVVVPDGTSLVRNRHVVVTHARPGGACAVAAVVSEMSVLVRHVTTAPTAQEAVSVLASMWPNFADAALIDGNHVSRSSAGYSLRCQAAYDGMAAKALAFAESARPAIEAMLDWRYERTSPVVPMVMAVGGLMLYARRPQRTIAHGGEVPEGTTFVLPDRCEVRRG